MNLLLDGKGSTSFWLCFLTSTIFPVIHLIPFIWSPLTASPYLHSSTLQLQTCLPWPDSSSNQENSYHLHGGSKSTTASPNTASKFKVRLNNIVTCLICCGTAAATFSCKAFVHHGPSLDPFHQLPVFIQVNFSLLCPSPVLCAFIDC